MYLFEMPLFPQKMFQVFSSYDMACFHPQLCDPRTALLIWAIVAMGGCFVLEQPRSSQLGWHPRIVELFRALPKVGVAL